MEYILIIILTILVYFLLIKPEKLAITFYKKETSQDEIKERKKGFRYLGIVLLIGLILIIIRVI